MNLLADESIDRPIVDQLRQDSHNVLYIAEFSPSIDDDTVLRRTNQNGALLITADKDFDELVFRLGRIHAGVVLIRLAGLSPQAKAKLYRLSLRIEGTNCSILSVSFHREGCGFAVASNQVTDPNQSFAVEK